MIISCNNCRKKFNIDSNLIPDEGRLVQCNSCSHKWFFKREITKPIVAPVETEKDEEIQLLNTSPDTEIDLDNNKLEKLIKNVDDMILSKTSIVKPKKLKSFKFLNFLIIFLVSFVALIIILDTFLPIIVKFVPVIEFWLFNLYEILKDITLFIKDLF